MRVILTQDVAGVGGRYDLVNVSDGYGRNYLLAKGLAEIAGSSAGQRAKKMKEKLVVERATSEELLKINLRKLAGERFSIGEPANEKGGLFASVTAAKVASLIKQEKGFELPTDFIQLTEPIKNIGQFKIPVAGLGEKLEFELEIRAS